MAVRWKLVQSFIREATEDENFAPIASIDDAYKKLRAVQRGSFSFVTQANGLIQISSTVGDTSFSFTVPDGISPADIMATVETALGLIEGKTVTEARLLLQRRKTTVADFSTFRLL